VTTPTRTVFDLARRPAPGNRELFAIDSLVRAFAIRPENLADSIRERAPGARLAVERIREVSAQPPLTR
jgi:hypothetical protein